MKCTDTQALRGEGNFARLRKSAMSQQRVICRKFSLDSNFSTVDGGKLKKSKSKKVFEPRKTCSLEESQLGVQDLSKNSSKFFPSRSLTVESDSHNEKPDGSSTRNSITKHSKTFHKLFRDISENENLIQAFTCALLKEVLYHGKLYVSENHVCFHSSVLLKDTKVVVPVAAVGSVKKQNTALLLPNALSIRTMDGEKYLFVSLRNRESCYKLVCSVCLHLETGSNSNSPQVSSAENSIDSIRDGPLSLSGVEDNIFPVEEENSSSQQGLTRLDRDTVSDGSESSREQEVSSSDDSRGNSWVWTMTERVKSALVQRETNNFNVLVFIYLILVVLLLLSSGYIGLRIVALEEQLSSMGALPHFSLSEEYKDT
nr:GRAM domain-containing protein 2B-like isoform X3 [Paramormyrops kingsleyae]